MAEFIEEVENDEWEVLTNEGWCDFKGVGKTISYEVYEVEFNSGIKIECADDHLLIDDQSNPLRVVDLELGETIEGKEGIEIVKSITKTDRIEPMYDLLDVDGSVYYTNDILSHNSTTFAVWVCHFILFNQYKEIVILANKQKQSKELLKRIKLAYMELPFWLQTGVKQWNTLNIELDNGCIVSAASTSSDTIRGESISVLIVDECIYNNSNLTVRDKETGEIKNMTIEELYLDL